MAAVLFCVPAKEIVMIKTLAVVALILMPILVFAGEVQTLNPDSVPAPFKNRFS